MKFRILAILIMCICSTTTVSNAQDYISAFGGWTDWTNLDADLGITGVAAASASADIETSDGFAAGVAIGRYLNINNLNNFSTELEFAYRNNRLENVTGFATLLPAGPSLGPATADLDGKINMYSGMYNMYYNLGTLIPRIGLRLYVGGGGGVVFQDVDVTSPAIPGVGIRTKTSSFAYQGIIGGDVPLTERISMFTEYRVFGIANNEAKIVTPIPLTADFELDGYTHNLFVGARLFLR